MRRFYNIDLSDRHLPDITRWVQEHFTPEQVRCPRCGRGLWGNTVIGYHHYRGWNTRYGAMWLFIRCPECRNELTFQELGVPGNTDFWEPFRDEEQEPAEART